MNDTLIIIMGHAEIQATFDRHLPLWEKHGCPLLVVCPVDSILSTKWPVLAMEKSSHNGPHINRKFRRILEFCQTMRYDRFVFMEYDALCIGCIPTPGGHITGNLFTSDQKEFQGHYFLHPPICFDQKALEPLVKFAKTVPDETDGFWDRYLGYLCEYGKVPFVGYEWLGFARNTIEPHMIPDAVAARKAGAVFFHGVKTEAVLNALLNA
jgi:hypothetical protein